MRNKKGEILIENIVFIILNMVFLTILVLFLLRQGSGAIYLEGFYAKEISLMIDSAHPGTIIRLNMEKPGKTAEEKDWAFDDIVKITGKVVEVKLSEKSGFKYSFFKEVEVRPYTDYPYYVFPIQEKLGGENE